MLLFGIYLLVVVALPVALSSILGFRALPRGHACPICAEETIPIVSRLVKTLQLAWRGISLQRRWCPTCDWTGYARATSIGVHSTIPAAPNRQLVRTLELGGRAWRVILDAWHHNGRYYGRLLFVGPSGKQWSDPTASFSAETHRDIVAQARSLSDRLLAYRLREVISG